MGGGSADRRRRDSRGLWDARRVDAEAEEDDLPTEDPLLTLRPLTTGDLGPYYKLVDRNRQHLTRHGDYGFFRYATLDDVRTHLAEGSRNVRLGVWHSGELIGRVDLNPINPPRWVLGYWLDERMTGKGLMTTACRAAVRHARALGASEIYAGVTAGNERSTRVLKRLGFEHIEDVDGRSRWRLPLIPDPPPPFMVIPHGSP
jgi:RimJ/RimL family protein N-acetyltransferase